MSSAPGRLLNANSGAKPIGTIAVTNPGEGVRSTPNLAEFPAAAFDSTGTGLRTKQTKQKWASAEVYLLHTPARLHRSDAP